MKRIKKLAALMMAAIMALAMSITAFATDVATPKGQGDFSITLTNDQTGHTYKAYQIFKGDLLEKTDGNVLSNIEWGTGVSTDGLIADLKKITEFASLKDDASARDVAELFAKKNTDNDSELAQKVADVFGAHLGESFAGATCVENKDNAGKTTDYVISPLNAGYYLVEDNEPAGEGDAYSRYIMEVVHSVTAEVKTEIPDIDKKIVEGADRVEANKAGVGQVVSYEITGEVPNYTGYDKYYYIINDSLSSGLTFNNDVVVKVGDQTLTANTDYYLYVNPNADGNTFQVAFANIKNYTVDNKIVVQYSATVNDNAVIGDVGNPNTVNLTYSNNPNNDGVGDNPTKPGTPDPTQNDPTGKSPDHKTITYVAQINILKTDGNNAPLPGAEFTLTGTSTQTILENRTYYEVDENGNYYLLKNGTYTTDVPQKEEKDEDGNITVESNENQYVSTVIKYTEKNVTETKEVTTNVKMVATSGADGNLSFKGLGAGTYTIKETIVPDGYNKAEDKVINITCQVPTKVNDGSEKAVWSTTTQDGVSVGEETGIYSTTIVNQSGSLLPSTGGIGTTIFYIVGAILVIGAGVILVAKKRMSREV